MPKKPNSRRNLDIAIERLVGPGQAFINARTILADAIVAQMLPDGAVKGGCALKLRFGEIETRFTQDLDTARFTDMNEYIKRLSTALEEGWQGFTGFVLRKPPAKPSGIPARYVMQPCDIKLSYVGKSWLTVPLEVGHNEIGDAEDPDMVVPRDAVELFEKLGFDAPSPIPVMRLSHQIAQKLHALSEDGSPRAHDLVDLQLIEQKGRINYSEIHEVCKRLFKYRNQQLWPPVITVKSEWVPLYAQAADGLDVIQDLAEAVDWANHFVKTITG